MMRQVRMSGGVGEFLVRVLLPGGVEGIQLVTSIVTETVQRYMVLNGG